ncbi:hypothetical protein [Cellulosimicrobium cellulans]|uniref:hypothetical protein n=1 Tax=Cellulosimicrobium cellulans TaxID=1710 RepID=UPI002ADE92E3|nr:hypothetical protein [Cellulosimicrobium cellulans]
MTATIPTDERGRRPRPARTVPGITACGLCAGETLAATDTRPGGQLERLRRIAESGDARLTVVDCLDACERGDVVVVRPVPAARAAGPAWFEQLAGDELTAALHSWIRAGGPGLAPLPDQLAPRVISTQAEVPPPPDVAAAG